ncbi:L-alanine dehydrogenase (NAD-dependent) [Petrocella atlantisensis]|uniref:Alanine dehydrogenase n=1 Tax=Petrocella atlantisensis TaxID=2173034 RepID=A0A3P7P0F9_9FIRM|nr:alanine dehydrogenase [Petrocella atlantisensis]VDN48685.1 L-alanine dehydrogenase (NAD-dependent) [Petrocella atlantisensis]
MIIGVPKEIKNNENRVALTPAGVHTLTEKGHVVLIETKAGIGSGIEDEAYVLAGATILNTADDIFNQAEMIMKVKEPIPIEYDRLKEGQILFTYLHLAPNQELTDVLIRKKIAAIAYETVELEDHSLPLLTPMSEVAGRMATQVGAFMLQKYTGGCGVLLGGVPGVMPGEVVVIGGGIVGLNATKMAVGLGAHVTLLDISPKRLAYVDDIFNGRVATLYSNPYNIAKAVEKADLLIGAVLIPGAKAPKLVTSSMVESMKDGAVIVDVAIDQGGSVETIDRITTHDHPSYVKHGVVHYAVANMPGAVPRTSTFALTGVTLPYALLLADQGFEGAITVNEALRKGVNTFKGYITYRQVAESFGYEMRAVMTLFNDGV